MAVGSFRRLRERFGLVLARAAFHDTAWGFQPVPEIDPGSTVSSLARLAGGVLRMRDRYRRR
ncbi:MAG: hypothetical protein ACRELG_13105 [Gemmataceae bacterium]